MIYSPFIFYLAVWMIPIIISSFLISNQVFIDISLLTIFIILATFFLFGMLQILMRITLKNKMKDAVVNTLRYGINYRKLQRLTFHIFIVWAVIYIVTIIYSGGFPLYWVLMGDSRTYVDFGVPTLSGLGNMLRAFCLTACYLIFKFDEGSKRKNFAILGIFLVLSAFLLETGRGNGVVLILHPIAIFFLSTKLSILRTLKVAVFTLLFLGFLGGIQLLRYDNGLNALRAYAESQGFEIDNTLLLVWVPALTYTTLPVVNTDLNIQNSPLWEFRPYYTLQGFLPTVIRDQIFEARDYGVLINEANNVTSFLTPIIRDFGVYGTLIFLFPIFFFTSYVYRKAIIGNLFHILTWPPLFMSIVLSFFSLFFTSLVVLLYPLLAYYVNNKVRIKQNISAYER